MTIAVLGAGAFGTSLAQSFAKGRQDVTLWGRDRNAMETMAETRSNPKLAGVALDEKITPTADIACDAYDAFLLAVPMQTLRAVLRAMPALNGKALIACCKGIELKTGLGPTGVIEQECPTAQAAILTGPSFAQDIAQGFPTALTLACADPDASAAIQAALRAPNLRIYRTDDTIGAECGGALKNVIAIACGAAIGAGLGESARAALMTRGFAEMNRLALKRGARAETLAGLSGLGDLSLTCSSEMSRNYRFGLALGAGTQPDASMTVEGAATARATLAEAQRLKIDMPITTVVTGLLDHSLNLRDAIDILLSRPQKEE